MKLRTEAFDYIEVFSHDNGNACRLNEPCPPKRRNSMMVIATSWIACFVFAVLPGAARATMPGRNGAIAFGTYFDSCPYYGYARLRAHAAECGSEWPGDLLTVFARKPRARRFSGGAEPSYSPSGRMLAFYDVVYLDSSVRAGIFIGAARQGSQKRLLPGGSGDEAGHDPSWSPSGSRLVFTRYPLDGSVPRLFTVGLDGSGLKELGVGNAYDADWSRSGRIAYTGSRGIYSLDRTLSRVRFLGRGAQPSWSPHGSSLAFTRRVRSYTQVFTMKANGSRVRQVTRGRANFSAPTWSPDGHLLAAVRATYSESAGERTGEDDSLVTLHRDGSHPHELGGTSDPYFLGSLAWQPLPAH